MAKIYRNGHVGALMDEYERAAGELAGLLDGLSDEEYELVRNPDAADESFRSIQMIMRHVVRAGYGHAGMLRKAWGIERPGPWPESFPRNAARTRIEEVLAYTRETLDGRWDLTEEEGEALQIQSRWGPVFNLEQLLEHMVVHMLRHRRQIERLLAR